MQRGNRPVKAFLRRAVVDGTAAMALSTALLAWRGRVEHASAAAPLNAVSHWLWGDESLRRNRLTWSFTGLGAATHWTSSLLWAVLYEALLSRRRTGDAPAVLLDAAGIAALAAWVDLRLVPERLTPGFERRMSRRSLIAFYVCFGAGLALGRRLLRKEH
jgi:hypothetical protein